MKKLTLCLMLAAGLAAGCGDDDNGPAAPEPPRPDSPEALIDLMEEALEGRSVEDYAALLTDDYTFAFLEEDVSEGSIPEFWERETETQAMGGLFGASEVQGIRVEWTMGEIEPPKLDGADAYLFLPQFMIEVESRLPDGEPLFFVAQGSFVFHLREIPDGDASLWKVVRWEDRSFTVLTAGPTTQTTWGQIKATFRWGLAGGGPGMANAG